MNPEVWRYIFDAIEYPAFLHDAEFRILIANRAYCREAGVAESEVLGKRYWEVFPPGDRPLPGCKGVTARKNRSGSRYEVSVGARLFLSLEYTSRDDQGKWLYALHIFSDITEQRKNQDALAESQNVLRRVIDTARDAIITICIDGEAGLVTEWNPAAEGMFGYCKEEVAGRDVHAFLLPSRLQEAAQHGMAHFAATGEGWAVGKTLELDALHKNGTEFPIELSLSATQIDGQRFATAIVRDITQRRQAQASELRYRRLFEAAKDGILILNAETGVIEDANPFLTDLLGIPHEAMLGKHLWDIGLLGDVAACGARFRELQQQGQVRYEDLPLQTAQGQTIHVEFVSNIYQVNDEQVIQCNIRDITQRKLAEGQSLRLGRMYRTISRCNEVLVRAQDELALSSLMCRVLVEDGGFRGACVMYGASATQAVAFAWAGLSEDEAHDVAAAAKLDAEQIDLALLSAKGSDVRNDLTLDPVFKEEAARIGVVAVAVLPVVVSGHLIGALWVGSRERDIFDEEMVVVLAELAGDLSFGIGNLRANAERMGILDKLEHSLNHAVTAIAATVEMRDPYTAGHQRRVAKLAGAIAAEMGLPEDRMLGLHMACVVHDIGKIHVPAEILSSPSKLSDAEFDILKTHPQTGWEILKGIDFPWPVAEIVYQHHEKLDGSGYPRGLKGDDILLEARILTVADVVEAMTSHRPYRPGFGIFPALQEISRNKGILYDTAVVYACLRVFMEKNYEWNDA